MEVTIGDKQYPLNRAKLRTWILLDGVKEEISKHSSSGDIDEICNDILKYVSMQFDISIDILESVSWDGVVIAFNESLVINVPKDFPIFRFPARGGKEDVWEYDGRTWYYWLHLLASTYGWSIDYIANLDIDDAVALLQEINIDEQLGREFIWMTSEIAYPYNETTKRGEFKPLTRPTWMADEVHVIEKVEELKKTKILKSHLPQGVIIHHRDRDVTH